VTKSTETVLDANTIPHVDIDFMNDTHAEEVEMVITLGNLIMLNMQADTQTADEKQTITHALENWLQHTKAHFSTENELMKEIQFPSYPMHAGEHESTLEHMTIIVEQWKLNHDIKPVEKFVFSEWPTWFEEHISTMDMMTAKFAVMNGYDPQSLPNKSTEE
jgi:hemerythrin